jgi:hypothetical protein
MTESKTPRTQSFWERIHSVKPPLSDMRILMMCDKEMANLETKLNEANAELSRLRAYAAITKESLDEVCRDLKELRAIAGVLADTTNLLLFANDRGDSLTDEEKEKSAKTLAKWEAMK